MISFTIPIKTVNESNGGGNSRAIFAIARRRSGHKAATIAAWTEAQIEERPALPCTVKLVRLSAGELDDDGLRSALKSVRDAVAALMDVDDGPGGPITWAYGQERCARGEYAVRVEFLAAPLNVAALLRDVHKHVGMASELLNADPAHARALLWEARDMVAKAQAELAVLA